MHSYMYKINVYFSQDHKRSKNDSKCFAIFQPDCVGDGQHDIANENCPF